MDDPLAAVAARLTRLFGMETRVARAVAVEVLDAMSQSVDEYIDQRHRDLKRAGLPNERIYEMVRRELRERRFAAPDLSERQIRRRIYG